MNTRGEQKAFNAWKNLQPGQSGSWLVSPQDAEVRSVKKINGPTMALVGVKAVDPFNNNRESSWGFQSDGKNVAGVQYFSTSTSNSGGRNYKHIRLSVK